MVTPPDPPFFSRTVLPSHQPTFPAPLSLFSASSRTLDICVARVNATVGSLFPFTFRISASRLGIAATRARSCLAPPSTASSVQNNANRLHQFHPLHRALTHSAPLTPHRQPARWSATPPWLLSPALCRTARRRQLGGHLGRQRTRRRRNGTSASSATARSAGRSTGRATRDHVSLHPGEAVAGQQRSSSCHTRRSQSGLAGQSS